MRVDITGQVFGRWCVVGFVGVARYRGGSLSRWLCRCACGNERVVTANRLRRGESRSCGCLKLALMDSRFTIHGHNRQGRESATYRSWRSMKERCSNSRRRDWNRYGGRGIRVAEQWAVFAAFLNDMGERPTGKTLDRIDPNGNYQPGNCRWADAKTQRSNRRAEAA